jgi:recombination protein RecR
MEQHYPSRLLEKAVQEFSTLPGIGRKTALRLVLNLLTTPHPTTPNCWCME